MENLQSQLIGTLTTLIIGLLNVGVGFVIYYVNQLANGAKLKNQATKDANQKVLIDNAIDRLNDLIQKSVIATQETLGNSIKDGVKDGSIDKAELIALKDKVLIDVQNQLTNDSSDLLSKELGDINSYISNTVETVLKNIQVNAMQ
jgi:hypothetical protein